MKFAKSCILCIEKEVTKKVYNNVMNWINSKKTVLYLLYSWILKIIKSDLHRLLFDLKNKINLKRSDTMVLYQTLVFTIHGKI